MISDRLKNALNEEQKEDAPSIDLDDSDNTVENETSKIITTQDELDAYYLIKSTLRKIIDPNRINYTDKETYFTVNIDGRPSKWICRLYIKEKVNYMVVLDGKEYIRYDFKEINDLYQFSDILEKRASELL